MAFLLNLFFENDRPARFRGWVNEDYDDIREEDTPFAYAEIGGDSYFIVVSGRMQLLERADIPIDSILESGTFLAEAAAEGDEIPYGKPFCRVVRDITDTEDFRQEIALRIREVENGEVELIDHEVVMREVREQLAQAGRTDLANKKSND